ncbi:MAG: aldehyde dehydrogenase [Pusillimonas sp.]|nr:aldehyde dehydrogenase [Pusillimonas sp.]MBC44059.1 aldehyde dehydrogenase [Pusillimonas sp.]HCP78829.1 aldehyde dehydrogenase [Pusillimonas sp.]
MTTTHTEHSISLVLPSHRDLYYGGQWHKPVDANEVEVFAPGTGQSLGKVAVAGNADVDAAVAHAVKGFDTWRNTPPLARARILKQIAAKLREHTQEIALLDAADCGNPVKEMGADVLTAAALFEFFAGLVTEMKGDTIPMGPDAVNLTVREPVGVTVRIVAFNHPFLFAAGKSAAPLAAGNAVIIKPPEQASLSALRLAEIIGDMLPPGVFSVLPGDADAGAALVSHPDVAMVGLVGSVATGRAVMKMAADTLKPVQLELGGKNAFIAWPDVDPETVAQAIVDGMNYTWCGQSCGSTSRAFVHADIYEAVIEHIKRYCAQYVPGDPTHPDTTMGAVINATQHQKILDYIESAHEEGARLIYGGGVPVDPVLKDGFFVEPTVFADVTPDMRLAREEVFGPILAVMKWTDEQDVIAQANALDYGLTCALWTNDLEKAHRAAGEVKAGAVWVNEVGKHFLGAPYGGNKQSGIGRDECIGEMFAFTQEKNIHISLRRVAAKT